MTHEAASASFSQFEISAAPLPSHGENGFIGPVQFYTPNNREFIGPRDATDEARGLIDRKIHAAAEVALFNVVHFPQSFESLQVIVQRELSEGHLRLNSLYPDLSADEQARQFVEDTVEAEKVVLANGTDIEARIRKEFTEERAVYQARIDELLARDQQHQLQLLEANKKGLVLAEEVRNLDLPQEQIIAMLDKAFTGEHSIHIEAASQPESDEQKSTLRTRGLRLLQFLRMPYRETTEA